MCLRGRAGRGVGEFAEREIEGSNSCKYWRLSSSDIPRCTIQVIDLNRACTHDEQHKDIPTYAD